jgi:hypothetical protein
MLKAQEVQNAHADVLAAIEAADKAVRSLVLLTPNAEGEEGKPGPKMFTQDMVDSVQHIARAMKVARLDALVIAQTLMNYTEETREAAVAAQAAQGDIPAPDFTPKETPSAES